MPSIYPTCKVCTSQKLIVFHIYILEVIFTSVGLKIQHGVVAFVAVVVLKKKTGIIASLESIAIESDFINRATRPHSNNW